MPFDSKIWKVAILEENKGGRKRLNKRAVRSPSGH
jgi:hypothetical protein